MGEIEINTYFERNNILTMEITKLNANKINKKIDTVSNSIKKLKMDENFNIFDIYFNYLKFYDNNFILQLLFHYKYKKAISTSDLIQQTSNEKFKISLKTDNSYWFPDKYLISECKKKRYKYIYNKIFN